LGFFREPQERYAPMKTQRNRSVESKVADQNIPLQSPEPAPLPTLRSRLVYAVYIAAIAVATLGWLFALKLI